MVLSEKSTIDLSHTYDVLIVGGGNAALCAAMTAKEAGVNVLLFESAIREFRGGNRRHTRNLRYAHQSAGKYLTEPYPEDEFWDDLLRVTGGRTNEKLARLVIRKSENLGEWMEKHGCHFQPPLRGTLHLASTNAFFLGCGKVLMNAYYATANRLGVKIIYNAEVQDLEIHAGKFVSATFMYGVVAEKVRAKAVVLASGGFQGNLEWLKEYWGEATDNFIIRGTPYDKGQMLRVLLDNGAKSVGDLSQCHAVVIDARAPKFDGGIVTRLDCVPFGVAVNKHAKRFYDEGEDLWPKRYAIWGRLVAQQPGQIAFSIIDSKAIDLFMPSVFPPIEADTMRELATKLDLEPTVLEETVTPFNKSIRPGKFDPATLDECGTVNLEPPKSHWARPINVPPLCGYPLRPGITYTYLGVAVNDRAQVIMEDNRPSPNIFAAGEIMSGNILGKGYMAGFGMTIGTVFGRIAGEEAAAYVRKQFS